MPVLPSAPSLVGNALYMLDVNFRSSTILGIVGAGGTQVVSLAARAPDGRLRPAGDVEAELNALARAAVGAGRKILLTVADLSKTGLISPGLDAVLALRQRYSESVEVLIDACQFRLSPQTLQAYLGLGFLVAVTGSKRCTMAWSGSREMAQLGRTTMP